MLNFLQQKNKNQIILEYLLRITALLLIIIFISSFVLISLFLPSFFFVKYKNDTVNNQLELIKQKGTNKGEDPVLFTKNINRLSGALYKSDSNTIYTDIINKIVSLKNEGIKITSITITEENNNSKKILLSGVAKTRDSLILYNRDIKTDGFFDSTIFPVSNFIKNSDSGFSATLIYKNK